MTKKSKKTERLTICDVSKRLLTETEFICICPSGLTYTKNLKTEMKAFRQIVMNHLKIDRLYKKHISNAC